MTELQKAAYGSALILAIGICIAAVLSGHAKYQIVSGGPSGLAYRVNTETGAMQWCVLQRCSAWGPVEEAR